MRLVTSKNPGSLGVITTRCVAIPSALLNGTSECRISADAASVGRAVDMRHPEAVQLRRQMGQAAGRFRLHQVQIVAGVVADTRLCLSTRYGLRWFLFDGDRFGQVPGLVNVAAPPDRNVVREQLQRYGSQHGRQMRRRVGNEHRVVDQTGQAVVTLSKYSHHVAVRAFTSCTLFTILSYRESCGAMARVGISWSIRAMGRASSLPPDTPRRGCN